MKLLFLFCLLLPVVVFGQIRPISGQGGGTTGATGPPGSVTNSQPPSAALSNLTANGFLTISNANLLFVDKGGVNSTAKRGRRDLPWNSLWLAKSNAVAGDTIVVFPGGYEGTNLWKNMVNWHFYNGCIVTNFSANPGGIFDGTVEGNSGAITSSITGDAIFYVAHTDTSSTNENGVISMANSNSVIYVHCKSIWGGADTPSYYALCLRDGFLTTIECDDINPCHSAPGLFGSAVLWHNGEASLTCNTINSDIGYGIWGHGFKAANFHVNAKQIVSTNYSFLYWEPTHAQNKIWLRVNEAIGNEGGVTLGALTQLGGKVYIESEKISIANGELPAIHLDSSASASHLWLTAQKVSLTNNARWFRQLNGTADLTVHEWMDEGNSNSERSSSWLVTGGTNYVHGGRFKTQWGPFCSARGGLSVFREVVIDTSAANQATNYAIWMQGGSVVLRDSTLISPVLAFSIGATNSYNIVLENVRMNKLMTNTITALVGPWTIDSNVQ